MPKAFLLKRYVKPEAEAVKKPWPESASIGPKNQDLFYFLSNTTGIGDVQDNRSFVSQAPFGLTSGAKKEGALPEEEEGEGMTEVDTSPESNQLAKPQKKSPGASSAQSGPVKPPYKCEQCGKVFKTKYTLTIHLKMPSHTGARPFVCGVCGKGFRLSSTLCRHKIIHTTEKPHKCSICHKAFNRSSTLKTHLRTHSEAKEFRCELCGKGFHQKGNLRNHILIHTGEKPYRCSLCEKAFNKLSNLKFHLHVHTDNAPYRCRYCKVHFSRRCDLKEHISASHKSI